MRRHRVMLVLAGAAAVWWAAPLPVMAAHAGGAAPAGTWGNAIEVPGLGALNKRGNAQLTSVSCGSAGNCAAGGFYTDGSGRGQAFVDSERNGSWGKAIEVPGSGTLNAGGNAEVNSVSCASAGNCAAVGSDFSATRFDQAFVVNERHGVWGSAIKVPGFSVLNKGRFGDFSSVSCSSAGNCAAGGQYTDGVGFDQQAFVVSERHGVWGKAIEVPGSAALNKGGVAIVESVSCTPAGKCAAVGSLADRPRHGAGFVVSRN
jgi:hypothetical protein